jgi:hypothetical protein
MVDRRAFLKRTMAASAGVAAIAGGFGLRRAYAVHRLSSEMMGQAASAFTEKEQAELERLPGLARQEIRRYVHAKCLEAHKFADEVCSEAFSNRLASCRTDADRQRQVYLAFTRDVLPEKEFQQRIEAVAGEIGQELDQNWINCCDAVAQSWGVGVLPYEAGFEARELTARTEPLIREQLSAAIRDATTDTFRPAIFQLAGSVGTTAMLLLPVMIQAPFVGVPVFAWLSMEPIIDFLLSLFRTREANVQWQVTRRLSLLSGRLGDEFEREIRKRICDLHLWQYQAVRAVAREQASRTIGWL